MMNDAFPPNVPSSVVAQLLRERGINAVAVIDDAYDPLLPTDLPSAEVDAFWAEMEHDDVAREFLESKGIPIEYPGNTTPETMRRLLDAVDDLGPAAEAWRRTVGPTIARAQHLNPFTEHLEKVLGLSVSKIGRGGTAGVPAHKIVFLDYYLGDSPGPEARRAAIEKARAIAERAGDQPLIVLMSSIPSVIKEADAFRRESGLLGGRFYCVTKSELLDSFSLDMNMHMFVQSIESGGRVQEFVRAIQGRMDVAVRAFIDHLRELTLVDYSYLQQLSLQDDGHPFGDYLFGVFSSHLGHMLFSSELRKERRAIDSLSFSDVLPWQTAPSRRLSEMYCNMLFDSEVEVDVSHPRDTDVDGASRPPYLSLGDIFTSPEANDNGLWMVVNAQCDLAFAPGAERQLDARRSVLLLPGRLQKLSEAVPSGAVHTDMFFHRDEYVRVLWDLKRVASVEVGEFRDWLGKGGRRRTCRLRLPYALGVQRALASDLTRVGVPVAPPVYDYLSVEIRIERDRATTSVGDRIEREAFVVQSPRGRSCVMTLPLVCRIFEALRREADDNRRTARQREAIGQALEDRSAWARLLAPMPIKKDKIQPQGQLPNGLCIGYRLPADRISANNAAIIVNLVEVTSVDGGNPEGVFAEGKRDE